MLLRSLLPVLAACAIAAQAAARDIHKRRARRALMQRLSRALVATVSIAGATTLVAPAAQAVEVPAAAPVMAELLSCRVPLASRSARADARSRSRA